MELPFENRTAAGRALAEALPTYRGRSDVIVLALPRGGVPVGFEIASALPAALDLLTVRKLGLPGHVELAMGAIASGGVRVLNEQVIHYSGVTDVDIDRVAEREQAELERRERAFRGRRPRPELGGRCAIIVDDGIATGATMQAAVEGVRQQRPSEVVVAVPVAPPEAVERLGQSADKVITLATPEPFDAIGQWYRDFEQTSNEEVIDLLNRAWKT